MTAIINGKKKTSSTWLLMDCLTSFLLIPTFRDDLVAFSVIIPFRYLFVVDDKCRCHQEYDSEEDTDEEKPTVKFIKTFST